MTTAAIAVGGVAYPIGTPIETVINAINALSHDAATIALASNPALTITAQELNLDLNAAGSYDNLASGLASDNLQGAIDELAANALPPTSAMYDSDALADAGGIALNSPYWCGVSHPEAAHGTLKLRTV